MVAYRACDICGGGHGCVRRPGDCVPKCPVGYPKPHDCVESGCFEAAADVRGDQGDVCLGCWKTDPDGVLCSDCPEIDGPIPYPECSGCEMDDDGYHIIKMVEGCPEHDAPGMRLQPSLVIANLGIPDNPGPWLPSQEDLDALRKDMDEALDETVQPYYYSCGSNYCDDPACIMNRPDHPEFWGHHPEVL